MSLGAHDFYAVVFFGIVAGRDHHSAVETEVRHREIEHGGADQSEHGHVGAGFLQSFEEGGGKFGGAEAAIETEGQFLPITTLDVGAGGFGDFLDAFGRQIRVISRFGGVGDPTDVVGAKNVRMDHVF